MLKPPKPKRREPRSLALRLTLAAGVVSFVLLLAAGLLLYTLFQLALERNFDARLQAVLDGLLANVELDEKQAPILNSELADARFQLPLSGWYWQIRPVADQTGQRELVSQSLLEHRLRPSKLDLSVRDRAGFARFALTDTNGTNLRATEQRYRLFGSREQFSFLAAGNFDELKDEVAAFRNALFLVLGLLGFGLLAALLVQVRYGLRPLTRLQSELAAIRAGETEKIQGAYPKELAPLSKELNLLIEANSEIVDRARTQVGNLAHALKTPLSVLTNEAGIHRGDLGTKVSEQTQVMRDQVSMYLDRARRAASARTARSATDCVDVVEAIGRTLLRIHLDRGIDLKIISERRPKFRGERQDLEEMVGNLLDNAFKFADKVIEVRIDPIEAESDDGRAWMEIKVGDDGPGLKPNQLKTAMQRGKRLDETKPGSGLGLSIVQETAAMYSGELFLGRSEIGGLTCTLKLPMALEKVA